MFWIAPLAQADAAAADDYFADGNRLFRDDLYWAALLRYRQAEDEGLSSPLLRYNTGIAHYRAGQHIRARVALLNALDDSTLRTATHYNLGLNAYELGELSEALRWFRLARDQNQNEKIRKFSVVAISRIRDELARQDEQEVRADAREKKRAFTNLELRARIGFANDDNVYRTPDMPYVDLADSALPVVVPVVRSGAYLPLSLSARYQVNSMKHEGFFAGYRLSGRHYQDKQLQNANEYQHEIRFGNQYRRKEGTRTREVHSAFAVAQHDETYFDHDDGSIRNVGGVDVDGRLNYWRYGPQLTLRQSYEKLAFGVKLKGQLWNYDETVAAPEYDHEYFFASVFGQFKFVPSSLLRVTATGYSRRFGDRPGFDLDGAQRIGNPNIRYDYLSVRVTARQRITNSMWIGFDLGRTERVDQYVGYNDYTRDSVGFEFHWSAGDRLDIEVDGDFNLYDYPNAFAFHNALGGRKTQESGRIGITAAYRMTRHMSLVAEAQHRETQSNDTRIQYNKNQVIIGVRWDQ